MCELRSFSMGTKPLACVFWRRRRMNLWFNVWWKHSKCVINQTIDGVKFRNWCYVCEIFKTYEKEIKTSNWSQASKTRRSWWIFVRFVYLHHSPSQENSRIIKKFMTKKSPCWFVSKKTAENFRASLTNTFSSLHRNIKNDINEIFTNLSHAPSLNIFFHEKKNQLGKNFSTPIYIKVNGVGVVFHKELLDVFILYVKESIVISLCIISPERITNFIRKEKPGKSTKYQQEHL